MLSFQPDSKLNKFTLLPIPQNARIVLDVVLKVRLSAMRMAVSHHTPAWEAKFGLNYNWSIHSISVYR